MGHSQTSAQYIPAIADRLLVPLMNDTKWDELRLAMNGIEPVPTWSTVHRDTGYSSDPDSDWFYHFRGGYDAILHVDIAAPNVQQRSAIRLALMSIHVPGEETDSGFRIFGYVVEGQAVDYI